MNTTLHGNNNFDKKYYARFFRPDGTIDSSTYENWFYGWYNFVKRYVRLEEKKQKKVLEVGTAIGALAKILAKKGFDVTATDISSFILTKAATNNVDIKFKKVDIEKPISLPSDFDYVFAFEVLEHLGKPAAGIKNIKKVLKKGGILIFSTPFVSKDSLKDPTHINVHNPDWWLKLGKNIGFSKVKFTYASFLPFFYRRHRVFSIGIPLKIDNVFANSTCFFFFQK